MPALEKKGCVMRRILTGLPSPVIRTKVNAQNKSERLLGTIISIFTHRLDVVFFSPTAKSEASYKQ
jgi:hypothetical protein